MATPADPTNPATPADLRAEGYTEDLVVGQRRLDQAWRALQVEIPSLPSRLADGSLPPANVADVLCSAAMRVLRNPDGVEQGDGAVDDYRESWKRADASADLYFTAAEIRRLSPVVVFPTSGSFRYC